MFSISDTIDSGEPVEIQIANYSEVGHKHEISDINKLQEIINELQERISKLEDKNKNITNDNQRNNRS